jgi:hypothetical protein
MWILRAVIAIALVVGPFLPLPARADTAGHVVISELQTGSSASSGQEFIELYNPTAADIDLFNWTAEYKSATSLDTPGNWKKYATLSGKIKAYGFYLISQTSYLTQADASLSASGLASTAGNVRIKDSASNVIDGVGYGATANASEAAPTQAPTAGQSIERLPGRLIEAGGNGQDTDDNSQDFIVRSDPQPQSSASTVELPASEDPAPDDTPGSPDSSTPAVYPQAQITELFIDPESPLSDDQDEYIELYNPNPVAIDLTGYTLKSGSNFHDYYNLPAVSLDPGAYMSLYSSQTHLSLVNSGGAAELLDPVGGLVDQTPEYEGGHTGESWAKFDSGWSWTLQTTPDNSNILVQPLVSAGSAKLATTKTAKKVSVVKPKTSKVSAPKKPKSTKAKTVKTKVASAFQTKPRDFKPTGWLIIVLGALTMGYAIYEFRYDLQNIYYRARGNR